MNKNKINPDNKIIHGLAPKSLTKPQVRFLRIKDLSQIELYQGTQITKPNPKHVHQVLGLSVAIEGMRFHQTKKDTFLVTPGSIVLVNINEMHSGSVPAGKTYTSRAIRIEQSLLRLIEEQLLTNSQSIITLKQPVIQDFELSKQILHLYEVLLTSSSNLEKECLLINVFANLYRRHGQIDIRHHLASKEFGPLSRVCDFLNDCFHENVSIYKLAEIAGLSPYHLSRVFSKEIGVSLHAYQLQIRLKKATDLLVSGMPIADVALETGFCDQSHLHRVFKKKFGITPGQYGI